MKKRTSWMTAIGSLSIFCGVLGLLLSSAIVLSSMQFERSIKAVESSLDQTSEREFMNERMMDAASETRDELETARSMILPDGLVSIGLSVWLIYLGIATLRMWRSAWWGSLLWSIVSLGWLILMIGTEPVKFGAMSWFILIYPVTLMMSFVQSGWRAAYLGSPRETTG